MAVPEVPIVRSTARMLESDGTTPTIQYLCAVGEDRVASEVHCIRFHDLIGGDGIVLQVRYIREAGLLGCIDLTGKP